MATLTIDRMPFSGRQAMRTAKAGRCSSSSTGTGPTKPTLFQLAPYLPLEPVIAALRAPLVAPFPIDGWSWYHDRQAGKPGRGRAGRIDRRRARLDRRVAIHARVDPDCSVSPREEPCSSNCCGRRPERFYYAVNLSGYASPAPQAGDAALAERRPPVFWGRGTLDDVIPAAAVEHTTEWLPEHTGLDGRIYEGLGHAISQQELADVRGFIKRQL